MRMVRKPNSGCAICASFGYEHGVDAADGVTARFAREFPKRPLMPEAQNETWDRVFPPAPAAQFLIDHSNGTIPNDTPAATLTPFIK